MSPEILRLKTFAHLSYAAIAAITIGMGIGMMKSNDGQSVLAFFTGGDWWCRHSDFALG
jgi:hypothetical protein